MDYGVKVHQRPTLDDTLQLLRLLGRKSWNFLYGRPKGTNDPEAVPSYIHYNAYRWLRDTGFKPSQFIASNATVAATSEITAGLLRYSEWRAAYPGHEGLGVLALGADDSSRFNYDMQPVISKPWVEVGVDVCIVACMVGGIVLVWRFTKRKTDGKPSSTKGEQDVAPNA